MGALTDDSIAHHYRDLEVEAPSVNGFEFGCNCGDLSALGCGRVADIYMRAHRGFRFADVLLHGLE